MIKYNWESVLRNTNYNKVLILEYFTNVLYLRDKDYITQNKYAAKIRKEKTNINFILNIKDFINNKNKATIEERVIYLDLISRRNLYDYLTNGIVYLKVHHIVGLYDADKLNENRLLSIKNNTIHFIYETGEYT